MNLTSFEELGIHTDLVNKLSEFDIKQPSPVQAEVIPAILEGKDVLAHSQTGTGKTLAYLLPILQSIDVNNKSTQKVILAPTQELAMQIVRESERYGEQFGISVLGLIGGAAIKRQIEKLKVPRHLVVGTPGRIKGLIELRKLKMHEVKTIVVDEVDQVFQLGSAGDVDHIIRSAQRDRQLVFLSATVSKETAALVKREMKEPIEVGIDPEQMTASGLEHLYFVSEERNKPDTLRRLIRHYKPQKAIVFVNTSEDIAEVEAKMNHMGLNTKALYGDADKMARSGVLAGFRSGKFQVLVASDLAARGLDIEGLTMVINYDPATDSEHYVHRAGRTGRMGRSGTVLSIVTDRQVFIIKKFMKELDVTIELREMFGGKVMNPNEVSSGSQIRKVYPDKGEPVAPRKVDEVKRKPYVTGAGEVKQRKVGGDVSYSAKAASEPREVVQTKGQEGVLPITIPTNNQPQSNSKKPRDKSAGGSKAERERIRKNKGAPKWLKNKPPRV
ncbi:superfamily II DNA/RNA helicase [Paenibacillus sp. DS2015]|uniref:DEAD/DEAH box helicase n=1 Tax=Paenibacillus sp. DS2015 TaxID=3373917 RepID=UPI003D261588